MIILYNIVCHQPYPTADSCTHFFGMVALGPYLRTCSISNMDVARSRSSLASSYLTCAIVQIHGNSCDRALFSVESRCRYSDPPELLQFSERPSCVIMHLARMFGNNKPSSGVVLLGNKHNLALQLVVRVSALLVEALHTFTMMHIPGFVEVET